MDGLWKKSVVSSYHVLRVLNRVDRLHLKCEGFIFKQAFLAPKFPKIPSVKWHMYHHCVALLFPLFTKEMTYSQSHCGIGQLVWVLNQSIRWTTCPPWWQRWQMHHWRSNFLALGKTFHSVRSWMWQTAQRPIGRRQLGQAASGNLST